MNLNSQEDLVEIESHKSIDSINVLQDLNSYDVSF